MHNFRSLSLKQKRLAIAASILFIALGLGYFFGYDHGYEEAVVDENLPPVGVEPTPSPVAQATPKKTPVPTTDPLGITFPTSLTWKSGRITAYADVPTPGVTLDAWTSLKPLVKTVDQKQVKGTYYYAYRKHATPVPVENLADERKKIEEHFAEELKKLDFSRRGPQETLTTLDDDYIRVKDGVARAVSVHIGAEYDSDCPPQEKTIVGELCVPLSIVNEVYSVFVSDTFTPTWKK